MRRPRWTRRSESSSTPTASRSSSPVAIRKVSGQKPKSTGGSSAGAYGTGANGSSYWEPNKKVNIGDRSPDGGIYVDNMSSLGVGEYMKYDRDTGKYIKYSKASKDVACVREKPNSYSSSGTWCVPHNAWFPAVRSEPGAVCTYIQQYSYKNESQDYKAASKPSWMDDDEWEQTGSSRKSGYSLKGIWSDYGWSGSSYSGVTVKGLSQDDLQRVGLAHKMTQRFVDSFARDVHYKVTFVGADAPAQTDIDKKTIMISAKPVLDKSLKGEEAGEILTGLAIHEIAHSRYGEKTREAVTRKWPAPVARGWKKDPADPEKYLLDKDGNGVPQKQGGDPLHAVAHRLANILDDVRIERRFVEEYPGYSSIFEPVKDYIVSVEAADSPDKKYHPKAEDQLNCAAAAIRYADQSVWDRPEDIAERDWWTGWSDRWSDKDDPDEHVKAVQEGIDHLTPESKQHKDNCEGEDSGGMNASCYAALAESGAPASKMGKQLSNIVEDLDGLAMFGERDMNIYERYGRVTMNPPRTRRTAHPNARAAAIIKSVLMRSRTGVTEITRRTKMGRLDNRTIHELAFQSQRLFTRRTSPSPGRYLAWVLIDQSGSMNGGPTHQTIAVAEALALATRDLHDLRMEIFSWSTGDPHGKGAVQAAWYMSRAWSSGEPIGYIGGLVHGGGGTPDSAVMGWSVHNIDKYVKNGEQPLILMLSDGQGDYGGMQGHIETARKKGIRVISVAIGGIDEGSQEDIYGKGNYIPWRGSIIATAKPLAELLGKLVGAS